MTAKRKKTGKKPQTESNLKAGKKPKSEMTEKDLKNLKKKNLRSGWFLF